MSEQKRGCGWRKIGGTYLIGGGFAVPCGRLPMPLHVCPTCSQGIKQSRGWTWVKPGELFAGLGSCNGINAHGNLCAACPLGDPARLADEEGRCGLLWVGEGFYKTPAAFMAESRRMGVCRRIKAPPKGAIAGKTWVLLAHPKAIMLDDGPIAGVFSAFKLTTIERCVSESEFADTEAMDKLRKRGIAPVALPDLPRHRGTVYDKEDEPQYDLFTDESVQP